MMPAQDLRALGRTVRVARIRAGLLQRDLARQLGVPPGWLSKVEMGDFTGARVPYHPERVEVLRRWLREQEEGGHAAAGDSR